MIKNPIHENEHCWILTGTRQGQFWLCRREQMNVGQPASVEFDPDWVIRRDEKVGDVIGFIHTHPSGSLAPSQRDINTMRAWCSCLGRQLLCLISHGNEVQSFLFQNDQCNGLRMMAAQQFDENTVVVFDANIETANINPGIEVTNFE